MSPEEILGPATSAAIVELIRRELRARAEDRTPAGPELISPEEASRRLGGRPCADTIIGYIQRSLIPRKVVNEQSRRLSYLVTVEAVIAALEATGRASPADVPGEPVDLEAARARARNRASRGR